MPDGELVEYGSHVKERVAPDVMGDIKPYQSMITGEVIESRSTHRAHLKQHGCIEVGNETEKMFKAYEGLSGASSQRRLELIRAQVDAMSHAEFRQALKRDVDRVKWNSRER